MSEAGFEPDFGLVELTADNGETLRLRLCAVIPHEGRDYAVFALAQEEETAEEQVLIMRLDEGEEGFGFTVEEDGATVQAVFDQYEKSRAEAED